MKRTHLCICSHPNKQHGRGRNKMNQTEMREAGKRCERHNTCYIRGTACWHVKRMSSACTSLSAQRSYAANDNKEVTSPRYYTITIQNYFLLCFEYIFYILRKCNLRNVERWSTVIRTWNTSLLEHRNLHVTGTCVCSEQNTYNLLAILRTI